MFDLYPKHKHLVMYLMFSDGLIYDYCSKKQLKFENIEEISIPLKDFK
jgi:hypothetical protein